MLVREKIRAIIKEKRTTQVAVARALDEPEYWVSDRLTGRVNLLAEELPAFATALGCTPCDFFTDGAHAQPATDKGSDYTTSLGTALDAEALRYEREPETTPQPTTGQRIAQRAIERLLDIPQEDLDAFTRVVDQLRALRPVE